MKVRLIGHTKLNDSFYENDVFGSEFHDMYADNKVTGGQAIALTAIRTCYSSNKPSEIIKKEGARYFGRKASDGKGGSDADRLIRMIVSSGHTSTLEHLTFTFAIEGVSRALLAQLTRHRVGFSYSVQSQRYVRFGSNDKTGGFGYVIPKSIRQKGGEAEKEFKAVMSSLQTEYDRLRSLGIPPEDARAVLPNAATCNLVMTANLRSLLDFYEKRRPGNGAQAEIAELAERLKDEVIAVEPWTEPFFAPKGGDSQSV